ncbi:VRR-NUC domain-containing protein [uncultured Rothia sp.]|uniref:VRR-NUC domain-containing protein n=1 Tax=uncultured Rothia sp. TaxID=316088 RepID=UPI003217E322
MTKPLNGVLPPNWKMTRQGLMLRELNQMSEKEFQDMVIGAARSLDSEVLIYHTYDSRRSEPGYPDLHLVSARFGISIFRELKTVKGRVSEPQKKWLQRMSGVGLDAAVWRPEDWASGRIMAEIQGKKWSTGNA